MAIREFQPQDWDDEQVEKNSAGLAHQPDKSTLAEDVRERLRKANEYFDKNPPRASSAAEIAKFLRSFD